MGETDTWLAERHVRRFVKKLVSLLTYLLTYRYVKKLVSRTGSTDNHATSGLKFKILVDFLSVGCSGR